MTVGIGADGTFPDVRPAPRRPGVLRFHFDADQGIRSWLTCVVRLPEIGSGTDIGTLGVVRGLIGVEAARPSATRAPNLESSVSRWGSFEHAGMRTMDTPSAAVR